MEHPFNLIELLEQVKLFAIGDEEFDVDIIARQYSNVFNSSLLLFSTPKSLSKRDELISSGLHNMDWSTMLDMSDNLGISETEACKYVNYAKSVQDVKKLDRILKESSIGESVDILGLDMYGRACEFFFLDCQTLLDLFHVIFSIRNGNSGYCNSDNAVMNETKLGNIMSITSHLLRGGIVTKLLDVMLYFLTCIRQHQDRQQVSTYVDTPTSEKRSFAVRFISKVAACVYIISFQTQLFEEESRHILHVIKALSSYLKVVTPYYQGDQNMLSALILLQLTQARIMSQQIIMLDRNMNMFPFGINEIGNSLPQYDSKEGLDEVWDVEIVKAFSCLIYGVFRSPMVELQSGGISSSNMIWFLSEAARLRAFSYIKTCIIPFIQTTFYDEEMQERLMSSLVCDLLVPLSSVLSSYNIPCLHIPRTLCAESLQVSNIDCLDDLLECFSVVGMAYPKFASYFWINGTRPAPFITRVVEEKITDGEDYLDAYNPIMHFLSRGACGGGRNSEATLCVFQYFYRDLAERHPWISTFKITENLTHPLGNVDEDSLEHMIYMHSPYLMATMDFFINAMQELQEGDGTLHAADPISRLFDLFLSPVHSDLKGTVLRAVAAIVRKNPSYVEDAWHMVEENNLLFPAMQCRGSSSMNGTICGNFSISTDLPTILEQVESTEGKYDVTNGFLVLLDALLEYGIPEKLGIGSRRPGILVYLEYIINEIILKASERSYEYIGDRWTVTARALQVLRRVLLKYPINAVHALRMNTISSQVDEEDEDKPVVPDAVCATIEFDFHEDSEILQTYEVFSRGGKGQQDWPTPKSAGFAVMSWLLQGGRLLESIFQILDENQQSIVLDVDNNVSETLRNISTQMFRILGTDTASFDKIDDGCDEIDCDVTYWRKAVVSTAVGILYECSRREQAFLDMANNANCQLTMITTIDTRPSRQPLRPRPLAELLLSHESMDTSPILMIAQYIKPGTRVGIGGKSLSVMCSALLKYVASLQNLDIFTYALSRDSVGLERLRRGCIAILQKSGASSNTASIDIKEQYVFPQGSDVLYDTPIFKDEYAISGAILKLILGTLYPDHLSMSHFLLGFDADVLVAAMSRDQQDKVATIHPLKLSAQLPDLISGNPSNCLEAVVDLICPPGHDSNHLSVICNAPLQAKLCLEIIYRLVSSTTTGEVTLALLRKTDIRVNIFERLLTICMNEIDVLSTKKATMIAGSEQLLDIDVDLSNVHQCISYVLKVCSIELHTLSQSAAVYSDNTRGMMSLLTPEKHSGERKLPRILEILSSINFNANTSCNYLISTLSSDSKDCMKSSVATFVNTHGIPALSLANEPPSPYNGFFQIAKDRLDYFLRTTLPMQQHDSTITLASQYNCLQQQASAAFHVSQAIKQFISIAVLECPNFFLIDQRKSNTNHNDIEGSSVDFERLVDCLIVPMIEVISIYPAMDNEIADEITTTLLSLVNMMNHVSEQAVLLTPIMMERIIRSLLAAVLCREKKTGVTRLSEKSRGNLYTCILHLLRYPSSSNQTASSQSTNLLQNYRICGMKTLEPVATILVDLLGLEIYSPKTAGCELCSLSATSLLSIILSTLGPCIPDYLLAGKAANEDFRAFYGSHVFLQCIQVLSTRGHIAQIVSNMNWKFGTSAADDIALQWILGMFTNVAMSEIGVQLLIDVGMSEKILGMDRFYITNENSVLSAQDDKHQDNGNYVITRPNDKILITLVNLLRTMVMSSPNFQEAIGLCTDFLHSNYNTVSTALSIGNTRRGDNDVYSMSDLELIESIVSLCSVVAAPVGAIWSSKNSFSAWDSGLGRYAEPLCMDICNLLHSLGKNICKGQTSGRTTDCWYHHITGSNDVEIEQMNSPAVRPSLVKALGVKNGDWNVLDNLVLECTLRILKYAAMTLRFRYAEFLENQEGDVSYTISNSASNFPNMAQVFINTSNLLLQEIEVSENDNNNDNGEDEKYISDKLSNAYKPEDSLVERALLFISENLICVIHSQISSFGVTEISSNMQYIERVLECADNFTSQSLIFRTGRFIKQKTIDSGSFDR